MLSQGDGAVMLSQGDGAVPGVLEKRGAVWEGTVEKPAWDVPVL